MEQTVNIEQQLKELLVESLQLKISPNDIANDENLLLNNPKFDLSSIDALEYLVKAEKHFDIDIEEEDLNDQLLQTINHLASYIKEKQAI
jgi:acyl carrier protein